MYCRKRKKGKGNISWLGESISAKGLFLFCLMFFVAELGFAQNEKPKMVWNGYTQLRYQTNLTDIHSFSVRRMKLWAKSSPDFSEHWAYKVQAILTSKQDETFVLQDVVAFYKKGSFQFNIGQFKPHYSLQWSQPDYTIPLTERAPVANALIPNGPLGVRDIGIEANYSNPKWESWLGVFNGYGIKSYRFNNSGFLLTNKTALNIIDQHLSAGYSVMYRKADALQLKSILPDTISFSGKDFRFNLFALYQTEKFRIQAEYLWANLNSSVASGYYILANVNLQKSQLVASWNQYSDLIDRTADSPTIHLGYNYLINGQKLKLMLDNEVQLSEGKLKNYFTTLQLQLFFN